MRGAMHEHSAGRRGYDEREHPRSHNSRNFWNADARFWMHFWVLMVQSVLFLQCSSKSLVSRQITHNRLMFWGLLFSYAQLPCTPSGGI